MRLDPTTASPGNQPLVESELGVQLGGEGDAAHWFTDVSKPKKLNRPGSVLAMVVSGPPRPRRIASPWSSLSRAANDTEPFSLMDGLRPKKS